MTLLHDQHMPAADTHTLTYKRTFAPPTWIWGFWKKLVGYYPTNIT